MTEVDSDWTDNIVAAANGKHPRALSQRSFLLLHRLVSERIPRSRSRTKYTTVQSKLIVVVAESLMQVQHTYTRDIY